LIPVAEQPEPADFEARVRSRGSSFLRHSPRPTQRQFRRKNYWRECLPQLYAAYAGVCAYSAFWLPVERSVDHFLPIMRRPNLAYEWSNYRLASPKLNSYKGDSIEVLDPFHILHGWFILNLTNFWVEPNAGLEPRIEAQVSRTIEILRLNSDDTHVSLRFKIVQDYAKGNTAFDFLTVYYPFIAYELDRQNQKEAIKAAFA